MTAAVAASANGAPRSSTPRMMFSVYRALRRFGESSAFLRHCVSVHSREACMAGATRLLQLHRASAGAAAASRCAPWYRPDIAITSRVSYRAARVRLGLVRGRYHVLNLVSDVLVAFTMVGMLFAIAQTFTLARVYVERENMFATLATPIYESMQLLETYGQQARDDRGVRQSKVGDSG